MSDASSKEMLSRLLRDAYAAQPVPDGPHVMEDDDLLARWSQDILSTTEREAVIDHLAICPECRDDLTAMVKSGVLQLPGAGDLDDESDATDSRAERQVRPGRPGTAWFRQSRLWLGAALAAAACVLVYFGFAQFGQETPADQLAKAETELEAGNAPAAYKLSLGLWEEELDDPSRKKLRILLAKSGYEVAREALLNRQYDRVLDIDKEIGSKIGFQAPLQRLMLQAQRRIPAEFTLAMADTALLSSNYYLTGQPISRALHVETEATEAERERFGAMVERNPGDAGLRINFAELLLEHGKYGAAREQFEQAVTLDSQNPLAFLGLGLATFELANNGEVDFEEARDAFSAALKLDPNSFAGHLNLAVCLERLADANNQANEHWRRAAELSEDPELRRRIQTHLDE